MVEEPFTRDGVIGILLENEYTELTFYKVNGELRDMVCTLNREKLRLLGNLDAGVREKIGDLDVAPEANHDPNHIRVFDLQNFAWRSFLLTNLVQIVGKNT